MNALLITERSDLPEVALIKGLAAAGIQLEVMCHPSSLGVYDSAGIPVSEIEFTSMIDYSAIRKLKVRLAGFSIVHAFSTRALSNALFASRHWAGTLIGYRGVTGGLGLFDPLTHLVFRNTRIAKIVCNCKAVQRYLQSNGLASTRLTTIYKGHNVSWYNSKDSRSLNQFGIQKDIFVVGFTGKIRPMKGVRFLLEALRYLPETLEMILLVVGEICDRNVIRLSRDPSIARRCKFVGFQEEAYVLTRQCDLFVMPSLDGEGFPKAVVEGMIMGVPPLVSKAGGLPELVRHGRTGLVVDSGDPLALAKAIRYLVEHREICHKLGANARVWVEKHLNVEKTVNQAILLYETLHQRAVT